MTEGWGGRRESRGGERHGRREREREKDQEESRTIARGEDGEMVGGAG